LDYFIVIFYLIFFQVLFVPFLLRVQAAALLCGCDVFLAP